MTFTLGLLAGLIVGCPFGMLILAWCIAARRGDRQQAEMIDLTRRRNV